MAEGVARTMWSGWVQRLLGLCGASIPDCGWMFACNEGGAALRCMDADKGRQGVRGRGSGGSDGSARSRLMCWAGGL
jgi:hypothetical protein